MEKFVEWIEEDVKEIANIPDVEMIFGPDELDQFNNATKCWIYKKNSMIQLMKKVIERMKSLKTIVIIQEDFEEQHITPVI